MNVSVECDEEKCVYYGWGSCFRGEKLTVQIIDNACVDYEANEITKETIKNNFEEINFDFKVKEK